MNDDKFLELLGSLVDGVWESQKELKKIREAILQPEREKELAKDNEARKRRWVSSDDIKGD